MDDLETDASTDPELTKALADARRAVRTGGTILLELDPEQMAPAAALLPEASHRVIRDLAGFGLRRTIMDCHPSAFACQTKGDSTPDTPGAPRDQHSLIRQSTHGTLLSQ